MALPKLDPHPLGCPIGFALTPAQMQKAAAQFCLKLRDVAFCTVHVVNPSKGEAYPMVNLLMDKSDESPRLVVFPGWEDADMKRRVTWKRQASLMKRIHDAGVQAERIDLSDIEADDDKPFEVSLACTAEEMLGAVHDLNDYLGDLTRITVTTLPRRASPDIRVVKVYAPNAETVPRVVFYPGWTGVSEVLGAFVDDSNRTGLRLEAKRQEEVPVEIFVRR